MRFVLIAYSVILFFLSSIYSWGQLSNRKFVGRDSFAFKRQIDTGVLNKWPVVGDFFLSNDGKFVCYIIRNSPIGGNTLMIQDLGGKWKSRYLNVDISSKVLFSSDSKKLIFKCSDTLYLVDLISKSVSYENRIKKVKFPEGGSMNAVACMKNNSEAELLFIDLVSNYRKVYTSVDDFFFNKKGRLLIVQRDFDTRTKGEVTSIKIRDLLRDTVMNTIWISDSSSKIVTVGEFGFDDSGLQLAFIIKRKGGGGSSMWYFKEGMASAISCATDERVKLDFNLLIGYGLKFSSNGRWLVFSMISEKDTSKPLLGLSKVGVWSYKDVILQPEQIRLAMEGALTYSAVFNPATRRILKIEGDDEKVLVQPEDITGDFTVLCTNNSVSSQYWWTLSEQPSIYLVSLKDGERTLLAKNIGKFRLSNFSFSPNGKYLTYWNSNLRHFFSFNLNLKRLVNITERIPQSLVKDDFRSANPAPVGAIAGWNSGNTSLLIYDNFDMWLVDVEAKKDPCNVTNGFGRAKSIKLNLIYDPKMARGKSFEFDEKDSLILTGFNIINKDNGFLKVSCRGGSDPRVLSLGAYTYYKTEAQKPHYISFGDGNPPVRAKNTDIWLVKRSSISQAPNIFYTTDFIRFDSVSYLHPQDDFVWITSQLITWRQFDGKLSQGILYKPENFDSTVRYPVIFHYYEKMSHRLNEFPYPYFTEGDLNIPWFVSRGYLVFTPDIHYWNSSESRKVVGEYAYNSIVSAARHLSSLPFVDSLKMALQGHSFGAQETNYLITRTNLFAAASEFAGTSDAVSAYLTLIPLAAEFEHIGKQESMELDPKMYGATLWQRPDLYLNNSAVLNADKVNTPLLIVHNSKDNQVQWRQGVEFYLALRRLGKKVWMLQYDDGVHLISGKDAIDYTIRLTQFFDYYLKGSPAARWMTEGIPAAKKGKDAGLELDSPGVIP